MARQGFDPEVRDQRDGSEIILHTCPFATTALADRETVCALHLGIAEGLAEGTPAIVTDLIAYDPRKADCRIRVKAVADEESESKGTLTLRGRRSRRDDRK